MDIYEAIGILNSNYAANTGDDRAWVRATLCNKERNTVGLWHYFFEPDKLQCTLHDIRVIKLLQTYEITITK